MRWPVRRFVPAAALPLALLSLAACDPPAVATFTVAAVASDAPDAAIGDGLCADAGGTCTLRAAVQEGNAVTTAGVVEIVVTNPFTDLTGAAGEDDAATGDLDLHRPFRIIGTGTEQIRPTGSERVFDVQPGGTLVVRDLELQGSGTAVPDGGGIVRVTGGGSVTIERSYLLQSVATGAGGGAVLSDGPVTVTDSRIQATNAIASPGGAIVAAQATIARSTIIGVNGTGVSTLLLTGPTSSSSIDSVTIQNTGVFGATTGTAVAAAGSLLVRDSTIAGNRAPDGVLADLGSVSVGNSLFALNIGPDCAAPVTSLDFNLEAGTSCGFTAANDVQGTAVTFSGVAFEGVVSALVPNAGPAIDQGGGCLATDTLGRPRPVDADGDGTATCDRGAYEADTTPLALVVDSAVDATDLDPGDGLCTTVVSACTLRAAVQETNAWGTADTITVTGGTTFPLTIAGAGEDLAATGDLDITDDLTLSATGGALATLNANQLDRVFDVRAGTVVLDQLAVTGGAEAAGQGGAGIRSLAGSTLTVRGSRVSGNSVNGGGGGGGLRAEGTATVERSTFNANRGNPQGGAVLFAGTGTVVNSTFAGNTATSGSGLLALAGASVTVTDSTIAINNTGVGIVPLGSVTVRNTIIANNAAGNCSAALSTLGHNLDSGATCGMIGTGDAQNSNPLLGGLLNNGGLTSTMLPGVGSPAIGTGVCVSPTDQRGTSRPQGGACDKGAVEQ